MITLERGGGFAGIANHQVLGPVAVDQIEPSDQHRVVALVESCFAAELDQPSESTVPDGTWAQVEVRYGNDVLRVRWGQGKPPRPELQELFGIVARHDRWRRPPS